MTAPGQDWIEQARRLVAGLAEHPAAEKLAAGGLAGALGGLLGGAATSTGAQDHPVGDCRWCPVCTGLAALRERRPDVVDAVADVLVTAAEALRAHAGTGARDATDPTTPDDGAREPGAPASTEEPVSHLHPRTARVQRIDVA
ncbi:hypothetical protein [Modestobacter roseus]|uniref:hypothetical protein n=1 Tax=Modestobacter roseus TaxID=1181884 RepID=UPI0034DF8AE6